MGFRNGKISDNRLQTQSDGILSFLVDGSEESAKNVSQRINLIVTRMLGRAQGWAMISRQGFLRHPMIICLRSATLTLHGHGVLSGQPT